MYASWGLFDPRVWTETLNEASVGESSRKLTRAFARHVVKIGCQAGIVFLKIKCTGNLQEPLRKSLSHI